MKQRTLRKCYSFEGKGLHTGVFTHATLKPASVGTGILFVRTDLGTEVPALSENVSSTARSTTIRCGRASVRTIEHIMSALTGLGVDNAIIEVDNKEMPILDGSARQYVEAILADGLKEQDEERRWVEVHSEFTIRNEKTGSWVRVTPAEEFSIDLTIDFKSRVIGRQSVHWALGDDYATEVAPCRTFCFLHEIELLVLLGLARGGDVNNAVIVVEKPVSDRKLARMARRFHQPRLSVSPSGYLSNVELRFPDECGRHKLLDLIGDIRLCGGFPKARIEAYKPGHSINTGAAKEIRNK